jgi:hypothetical protein
MEIFFVVLNTLSIIFFILCFPLLSKTRQAAEESEAKKSLGGLADGYFLVSLFFILKYVGIGFINRFFGWIIILEFCWIVINMGYLNQGNIKKWYVFTPTFLFGCGFLMPRFIGSATLIYQLIIYIKS